MHWSVLEGKSISLVQDLTGREREGTLIFFSFLRERQILIKLSLRVQARFFSKCEEKIDVVIYDRRSIFCREILKNAERLDTAGV
jgi:hypothetical protein